MVSQAAQEFNAKVAESLELREKLKTAQSPIELLALAKAYGFELTGDDLKEIAQKAYHQWFVHLSDKTRPFFEKAHSTAELNQKLKTSQTPVEVVDLAKAYGFEFTEADLKLAAIAAESVEGFSFEKLWFRQLGLIS
ncbi:MAG: Nif11-like leader peptide family natural product precursor [Cyanobacteria bacterium RU_5_0]|nr:Nif11-like leader peptide family natural product precursor [Cyanobacteria bacterium RU_5_0]